MTSKTVENGAVDLVTSFGFDNRGVLTSTVEPRGNLYGADPAVYRVDYTVDALGHTTAAVSPPVSVTDNGVTTAGVRPTVTFGFDTYGQQSERRDERGYTTAQTFDRLGRVVKITHPAATVSGGAVVAPTELFGFDPVGNLTSRTDRRGKTTTFVFDGLNRVTTQLDPAVGTAARGKSVKVYDDTGNVTATVEQRGARHEASFDDAGRQRTSVAVVRNVTATADRFKTTYDYDDLGDRTWQQTPTGDVTSFEYNPASEQTKQIDPTSAQTVTGRDVGGRAVSTTDPLGRTTTFEFDLAGRQVAQRAYGPGLVLLTTATTGYDAAGNVTAVTSPRGVASGSGSYTSKYSYDAVSRLTGVSQPVTAVASMLTGYGYDAAGNQTVLVDGRNNTTSYSYNPWNLQASLTEPATAVFPAAVDRTLVTEYDAGGLAVKTVEPGAVTVTRTFDELGRVVSETGSGAGAATATRSFAYDAAGNRTTVGAPAGDVSFVYDDRGLLTQTTGPVQYQSGFVYDQSGRMKSRSDAAGTSTFTWNSRNQLETVTDGLTGTSRTNTFDPAGQLATVAYTGGATRTLGYDGLGRLTSDQLKNSVGAVTAGYSYGYDPDSHITSRTVNLPGNPAAGTSSYAYDNAGRLASWTRPDLSAAVYAYDNAGNLTGNAGVTASFDARNQLQTTGATSYTWTARGTLNSTVTAGVTTTSTFDGLDRNTATGAQTYTYDSLDRVAVNGPNVFSYAGAEIDPVAVGATRFARSPAGLPVAAQVGAGPASLFGRDRHGDIGYQHQPDGAVTATRAYDPFGAVTGQTGTLTQLGFQGDYTDPASGDVWMGARWYRPGTGTFTNRDTVFGQLKTPVSLNRYTYAHADPLGMYDPDGRSPEDACRGAGAAGACAAAVKSGAMTANDATAATLAPRPTATPRSGARDQPRYDHQTELAIDAYTHSDNLLLGSDGAETRYQCEHGDAAACVVYGQYRQWARQALGVFVGQMKLTFKFAMWMTGAYAAAVIGPIASEACWLSPVKCVTTVSGAVGAANGDPSPSAAPGEGPVEAATVLPLAEDGGAAATAAFDIGGANFAQTTASGTFSSGGSFAGQTIDDVAGALQSGAMSVKDVPVQVIVQDGNTLILNTRSALALEQAGISRSAWNVVNMTGDAAAEARLAAQLARNGLDSTGTGSVRITGGG